MAWVCYDNSRISCVGTREKRPLAIGEASARAIAVAALRVHLLVISSLVERSKQGSEVGSASADTPHVCDRLALREEK
jgi:hypothetical protein